MMQEMTTAMVLSLHSLGLAEFVLQTECRFFQSEEIH
jgi:hypothetical protein